MSSTRQLLVEAAREGARGLRVNLRAGVVSFSVALLVVGIYYGTSWHAPYEAIATLNERYGFLYSAIATALCGGVLPVIVLTIMRRLPDPAVRYALFAIGFWAVKGMEVDLLYRLQKVMFGADPSAAVIAKKVVFDQFVYNPVWASPTMILLFRWRDVNFSFGRLVRQFDRRTFIYRVIVVLLSSWVIWVPSVAVIYSLPPALQVPLFNIVLCFFVLVLTVVTPPESPATAHVPPPAATTPAPGNTRD